MSRKLIVLAVLAAGLLAVSAPAQSLYRAPFFYWDKWGTLLDIGYTDSVTRFGEKKSADAYSVLVYMQLGVMNGAHEGRGFIPQNCIKIIIGDDEFDAADLDEKCNYSSNNIDIQFERRTRGRPHLRAMYPRGLQQILAQSRLVV
jgi:hypothetical protein